MNTVLGRRTHHHDTIVVGGRCAGAATAMLLARAGQRVLVLESARPGTDTLSTPALMRAGVVQLHRWGLLGAVAAAGTPAIRRSEFHYGDHELDVVDVRPGAGVTALRAPRRTVLDPILATAAMGAGADFRFGARVTGLLRDRSGRVTGVEGLERGTGARFRATADLTIGADGIGSTVAAAVAAPARYVGKAAGAFVHGYFPGAAAGEDRYRYHYRDGAAAGAILTNDGQLCVWLGIPRHRFAQVRRDLAAGHRALLAEVAPPLARELAGVRPVGPVRGFPGIPGYLRAGTGPGWALVGDAGWFTDPITAYGMTAALRDAELLARAVLDGALPSYEERRDELSLPLLAVSERIASYSWGVGAGGVTDVRGLLVELGAAMRPAVDALLALDDPASRPAVHAA